MRTIFLMLSLLLGISTGFAQLKSFTPGAIWKDNNGVHINAHGGGILCYEGVYYWFGEHKTEGKAGNMAQVGVHCYSSTDLYNWTDRGIALSVSDDPKSDIVKGCILERPKVIYNQKTGKFVMYFHLELKGMGYAAARTGIAVSDKVTGPYKFLKSLRPNAGIFPVNMTEAQRNSTVTPEDIKGLNPEEKDSVIAEGLYVRRDLKTGQMSRDMTLYVDDDQKAYHIFSSEENKTLHIAELTDDSDIIYETQRKITEQAVAESGLKPFPAGTVLLSSRAPIRARRCVKAVPMSPMRCRAVPAGPVQETCLRCHHRAFRLCGSVSSDGRSPSAV